MKYGQFIDRMNDFVAESGINNRDHDVMNTGRESMKTLDVAISVRSPILSKLPPGQPIGGDIVIDSQTANDALERLRATLREENAAVNLMRLLDEEELLTFHELSDAFRMFAGDLDTLYEFVVRREYMRNIPPASPLHSLIQCILERRDDYEEVLQQEIAKHDLKPIDTPHSPDVKALLGRFEELLKECMNGDAEKVANKV